MNNEYFGIGSLAEALPADEGQPDATASPLYLPPDTVLNGQYRIGRVLGHGGFGITYLAWDLNLQMKVAVKEYLPGSLATRRPGSAAVSVYNDEARSHFQYGLGKFVEEARALAQFDDHPGIVSVVNFFHANGTAYIVMTYLEGITLEQYRKQNGGRIPFDTARNILLPVMDALREVHGAGMLHRDISPDNIYITNSVRVKLLDFGAAKYAIGERSQSLSVILKPGYAPEEQYRSAGKQGPWTDVYALGATLYRAITGQTPPGALDRLNRDEMKPPSQLGVTLPAEAEEALMKALAVRSDNRFQDVAALQAAIAPPPSGVGESKEKTSRWPIAAVIFIVLTLITAIGWAGASSSYATSRKELEGKLATITQAKNDLEARLNAAFQAQKKLAENYPSRQITITGIRLTNKDKDGKDISGLYSNFTRRFPRQDIRYLTFYLSMQNNWVGIKDLQGELGVKYFAPGSDTPMMGEKSRNGFTLKKAISVSDSASEIGAGWGNADYSIYQTDTPTSRHRIEFWWGGEKIGETYFEVYESLFP